MMKRIIAFLLSGLCIVGCIAVCCIICNHPSEEVENTVSSFYREPDGSLDVVALGASATGKAYYPSVVWKTAGITSYCFQTVAVGGNVYPSMLREVYEHQPQAVLLVDLDGFTIHNGILEKPDPIRLWVDSMPRSINRLKTIRELCPNDYMERLFPFSRYHRNMTTLVATLPLAARMLKKQILGIRDPMKGALYSYDSAKTELKQVNTANLAPEPLDTLPAESLEVFLALCQEYKLEKVIFVDFPKGYDSEGNMERNTQYGARVNMVREIVAPYGYEVWNYNDFDNPADLDMQADFQDTLHLNTKGATKFSAYMADYLSGHFTFPEKSDALTAMWNEDTASAP